MTDSSLQDRIREHAKAFDGLLSLIPAKMYYGEDNSDQWNKKKQTKAEAKAARMNKFDPDSDLNRNAKEIMDERAAKNKRKREEMQKAEAELPTPPQTQQTRNEDNNDNDNKADANDQNDNDDDDVEGITKETPGEGLRRRDPDAEAPNKKQKLDPDFQQDSLAAVIDKDPSNMTQDELMRVARMDAKRAERKVKQQKKAEKRATKQAAKQAAAAEKAEKKNGEQEAQKQSQDKSSKMSDAEKQKQSGKDTDQAKTGKVVNDKEDDGYETVSDESNDEGHSVSAASKTPAKQANKNQKNKPQKKPEASADSSPRSSSQSPVFDTEAPSSISGPSPAINGQSDNTADVTSTNTSINSQVPPSEKPKHIKVPQDTSALKARLAARIAELKAARKAIGPDGKPIRTRQELIEAQRARQEQRKAHKKEQRRQAKIEEDRERDKALASNSPSIMSPALDHLLADDDGNDGPTDYSFGRVMFNDDTKLSRDLTYALNGGTMGDGDETGAPAKKKKKGPSDPKTALIKLQNQKKRFESLDDAKKQDIAEKDTWLQARRRAEGEKIRDDEAMLKKTIKRKEKAKKKSEKEWKERSEGTSKAIREKQRKREENLKKRKDEKKLGKAGKKKVKVGAAGANKGKKKGGRPGFEGSFGGMGKKK